MERRLAPVGRPRAVAVCAAFIGIAALVTPLARPAAADPLSSDRAQAAQLAQKIDDEQLQVEDLSNQFDAAQLHLQQVQAQVASAKRSLSSDQQQVASVRQALTREAVNAYTAGGFVQSPTASPSANLNPMVASSYFEVATGNQTDTVDKYRLAERNLATQQQSLSQVQNLDTQAVAALAGRRQAAQAAQQQASATLDGLNGQIAQLVAQQQEQQRQARAAQQLAAIRAQAAKQQQQAQQAATVVHAAAVSSGSGLGSPTSGAASATQATQATQSTQAPQGTQTTQAPSTTNNESGQTPTTNSPTTQQTTAPQTTAPVQATPSTTTAPAPSLPSISGAAGVAVSVALAQIGKPYQWGAEGPGSFDCSGLVAYAYAAAGVHLDHYTGAQWAETTQIPLSAAGPGDLIFFNGLGHVGIYLGGGMMVDAPNTGSFVRVESIYGFGSIDGATRVG